MMRKLLCTAALIGLVPASAGATVLDPNFVESDYVTSPALAAATGLAWAPDGSNRLFVSRKDGQILVIKNGQLLPTPFATITPIYTVSECGLVGIAFDPDFLANHWLYAFVTVSGTEQQIIRYTADGDLGIDKKTIVAGLPTVGANHDGGAVGVGPDGNLYWAIGDNGAGIGVKNDLTSLASKVGRANRDGTPPADNPFRDGSGGPRDFIWARGLRNPFTLAFQPATGLLWLNVVGTSYEQIFIVKKGDHAGWSPDEAGQTAPDIRPVIKYVTNNKFTFKIPPVAMNGVVRKNGVATFSAGEVHLLALGEKMTISGMADPSFNGTYYVSSLPSATTFSVQQPGPDAVSGSPDGSVATAVTPALGGCVTGGDFYDSSQVPAPYRGNFFFGDYNSGKMMRTAIDPTTNLIASVDVWADSLGSQVDVALGPDGALYSVATNSNKVRRTAYKAPATEGLVVTPLHVWTAERQTRLVNVQLATAPAADLVVTVGRASGDADITVSAGATLTFTPANWNVPQTATIAAAADLDRDQDQASISISASGVATETVLVRARDDEAAAPPPEDAAVPVADAAPDALDGGGPDAAADAPGSIDAASDAASADGSAVDAAVADARAGTGGAGGTGGAVATGGSSGTGGALGTGGSGGGTGGTKASSSDGCGCHLGGRGSSGGAALGLALAGLLLRRRRRATSSRS